MLAIRTLRTASQSRKSRANQTISPHAKIAAPQNRKYKTARGSAKSLNNKDACTGINRKASAYRIATTEAIVR